MADKAEKKLTTYVVFEEVHGDQGGKPGLFAVKRQPASGAPAAIRLAAVDLAEGDYTLVAVPEGNITRETVTRRRTVETLFGEDSGPEVREVPKSGEAVT